jgi:hypothetical protein
MHFSVEDNSSSNNLETQTPSRFNITSCTGVVITCVSKFLSFEQLVEFAAANKQIKKDAYSFPFPLCSPVRNLVSLRNFLANNPNLNPLSLNLQIENSSPNQEEKISLNQEEKKSSSNQSEVSSLLNQKEGLWLFQDFFPKIICLDLICTYPDPECFTHLTKLEGLALFNCKVDISVCTKFPMVKKIILKDYPSEFSSKVLRSLPLEVLDMDTCPLIKLDELTDLPNLRQLTIRNIKLIVPAFKGCDNLQILELENVMAVSIEPLHTLKSLKEFLLTADLTYNYPLLVLDFLQNCKSLTSIVLARFNLINVNPLSTCPCLERIRINRADNLVDISSLVQLSCIKSIAVFSEKLDITNIIAFPPTVVELKLFGKRMNGNVSFPSKMEELNLEFEEYIGVMSCLDSPLLRENLRVLSLEEFKLGGEEEKHIAKLTKLEELHVSGVTGMNVHLFNNLIHLHTIGIYHSTIFSLDGLRNCSKVRNLRLSNNPGLVDIQGIKNFPLLEEVDFEVCPMIINIELVAECPKLIFAEFIRCGNIFPGRFKQCLNLERIRINGHNVTREQLLKYGEEDVLPILVRSKNFHS